MYDENHVTIVPKSGNYIKSDRYKLWDCFLCGELVGGIQFITDGGYKKHYESQVLDSDGRGPMRFVGRHNSLYEAKVALVEPAREYLRKKKEILLSGHIFWEQKIIYEDRLMLLSYAGVCRIY